MSALRDYIARLQAVSVSSQEEQIFKILKENEATAVDLNLSQLEQGINSDGSSIEPPYRELTVEIKKAKGQRSDRVTLKDEGDFYGGFFIDSNEFPAAFWSKDYKVIELTQKYGSDFFGLTGENQTELNYSYLLDKIQSYYREVLLLR